MATSIPSRKIRFTNPLGESQEISDSAKLAAPGTLLLSADQAYWKKGAGNALFHFESRARRSELCLMFRQDLGIALSHNFKKDRIEKDQMYVSVSGAPFDRRVSVFSGGDFFLFWAALFIPKQVAWEAIMDFCADGRRSQKIHWQPYLSLPKSADGIIHGAAY
jgi:hypothetical protein